MPERLSAVPAESLKSQRLSQGGGWRCLREEAAEAEEWEG